MRKTTRRTFLGTLARGAAALSLPLSVPGLSSCAAGRGADRFMPGGKRPNILFIFTDDQTFRSIGSLNNPEVATPNIDRLVREGTTFIHAFNEGSFSGAVCIASRAMLNTGRHLWLTGGGSCGAYPLWPETFRKAGYDTFETGKWHNGKGTFARSFMAGADIFFGGMHTLKEGGHWTPHVYDFDPSGRYPPRARRVVHEHSSELFADAAVGFLRKEAGRDGRPFFMYVAFTAPHDPRQSPKAFTDRYPPEKIALPPNFLPEHPFDQGDHRIRDEMLAPFPRTPKVVRENRAAYYAMITHADAQIGRILDALDASGHRDDTIVVFSADHGLAVGQHGLMGKQNQYDHSVRMPLIFRGPGIAAGRRIDALVYLHCLFPTTCEMAKVPVPPTVQSKGLVPLLTGARTRIYDSVYGGYKTFQRMVRTERYKMILYPQVREVQLFDETKDPFEFTDLAEDPRYAPIVEDLYEKLLAWQPVVGDSLDLEKAASGLIPGKK